MNVREQLETAVRNLVALQSAPERLLAEEIEKMPSEFVQKKTTRHVQLAAYRGALRSSQVVIEEAYRELLGANVEEERALGHEIV